MPDRPHTQFNFVSTLDGRGALNGSTRALGGPADLELLLSLRAAADAVLVGPGTIRAEGYGRLVGPDRRPEPPPLVMISRRFDIPWEALLFEAPDQPVIIYGPADAPAPPDVAAPVEIVRLEDVTPAAALADLYARGVRTLLSEGGPTLFRGLLADGLVDELFLTPLAADHGRRRDGDRGRRAACRRSPRFTLGSVHQVGDELFLRYAIVR